MSNLAQQLKDLVLEAVDKGADNDDAVDILGDLETLIEQQIGKALEPLEAKITNNFMRGAKDALDGPKVVKGQTAARALRSFIIGGFNKRAAIDVAKEKWGDNSAEIIKTLTEGSSAGGGFLISGDPAGEIIELLRPRSVLRSLGPIIMPMNSDTKPIPRIAGGASSGYVGENTSQTASDVTFNQLVLRVKKLRATVAISNELQDDADGETDQLVINDIVSSMAVTEDENFIRSNGTLNTPKGLRYWVPSANVTASAAANDGSDPTLAEVRTDIRVAINDLTSNNTRMIKPAWIMSNRSHNYLAWNVVDSNGNLPFAAELAQGKLNGWPVGVTNNIPDNLAAGTAGESELYLVDMADVVIGDRKQIEFKVSDVASFTNSAGSVTSAFDNDLIAIRAISRHDLVVRHSTSIAVISGIVYGG